MKNIYAIFAALDEVSKAVYFKTMPELAKKKSPIVALVVCCNDKELEIPLYTKEHQNIAIALMEAKDKYLKSITKIVDCTYNVSILSDANRITTCIADLFENIDVEMFKLEDTTFADILLSDIDYIESGDYKKLHNDTSLYGDKWINFIYALEHSVCKYWADLYDDIFKSRFKLNVKALECRINVPDDIKDLGAKKVAEYLLATEKQSGVEFQNAPKFNTLEIFNSFFDFFPQTGIENHKTITPEKFFFRTCSKCDEISDANNEVCPFCGGAFKDGIGIGVSVGEIGKLLDALTDGYKLTCSKCAMVFNSQITNEPCPRCGDTNTKNFTSKLLNGVIFSQGIKIVGKDTTKSSSKSKVYEMRMRDEKPQSDGSTAMYLRIVDKEKNDYQERVIDNQTGEIKHECHEPLSEHQGHGSAKPSNKNE